MQDVAKRMKWLLLKFTVNKQTLIHYHGYDKKMLALLSIIALIRNHHLVFTLHSFRISENNFHYADKIAFCFAKISGTRFISVGPEIMQKLINLNVRKKLISVIPGFIPPTVIEEDIAEVPSSVWAFIDKHKPVITANAFKISFYNGQDLYGIDMCIELCARLKSVYQQIGFVFCLPDIGDHEYFDKMNRQIENEGLEENFLFQTKACQMYPIITKSDLFVRPTNTDGYGISIAEAIHFNIPAVASNVCQRPEGTILFKNQNIDDFVAKVKDVLANYEQHKRRVTNVAVEDNAEKILSLYKEIP